MYRDRKAQASRTRDGSSGQRRRHTSDDNSPHKTRKFIKKKPQPEFQLNQSQELQERLIEQMLFNGSTDTCAKSQQRATYSPTKNPDQPPALNNTQENEPDPLASFSPERRVSPIRMQTINAKLFTPVLRSHPKRTVQLKQLCPCGDLSFQPAKSGCCLRCTTGTKMDCRLLSVDIVTTDPGASKSPKKKKKKRRSPSKSPNKNADIQAIIEPQAPQPLDLTQNLEDDPLFSGAANNSIVNQSGLNQLGLNQSAIHPLTGTIGVTLNPGDLSLSQSFLTQAQHDSSQNPFDLSTLKNPNESQLPAQFSQEYKVPDFPQQPPVTEADEIVEETPQKEETTYSRNQQAVGTSKPTQPSSSFYRTTFHMGQPLSTYKSPTKVTLKQNMRKSLPRAIQRSASYSSGGKHRTPSQKMNTTNSSNSKTKSLIRRKIKDYSDRKLRYLNGSESSPSPIKQVNSSFEAHEATRQFIETSNFPEGSMAELPPQPVTSPKSGKPLLKHQTTASMERNLHKIQEELKEELKESKDMPKKKRDPLDEDMLIRSSWQSGRHQVDYIEPKLPKGSSVSNVPIPPCSLLPNEGSGGSFMEQYNSFDGGPKKSSYQTQELIRFVVPHNGAEGVLGEVVSDPPPRSKSKSKSRKSNKSGNRSKAAISSHMKRQSSKKSSGGGRASVGARQNSMKSPPPRRLSYGKTVVMKISISNIANATTPSNYSGIMSQKSTTRMKPTSPNLTQSRAMGRIQQSRQAPNSEKASFPVLSQKKYVELIHSEYQPGKKTLLSGQQSNQVISEHESCELSDGEIDDEVTNKATEPFEEPSSSDMGLVPFQEAKHENFQMGSEHNLQSDPLMAFVRNRVGSLISAQAAPKRQPMKMTNNPQSKMSQHSSNQFKLVSQPAAAKENRPLSIGS